MFYHAINGEGTSPQPEDLSPVLLWTNPNPEVAFAAQTVELDLSEYAGVIIEYKAGYNSDKILRVYYKKTDVFANTGAGYVVSDPIKSRGRNLDLTDSKVHFGYATENDSVNNLLLIPVKIYGVKKYVVEPVESIEVAETVNRVDANTTFNGEPNTYYLSTYTTRASMTSLVAAKGEIIGYTLDKTDGVTGYAAIFKTNENGELQINFGSFLKKIVLN